MRRCLAQTGLALVLCSTALAAPPKMKESVREHVLVQTNDISAEYTEAIATLSESVWRICHEGFGLAMPQVLTVRVNVDRGNRVSLLVESRDRIQMTLKNAGQLERPEKSRHEVVYGLTFKITELGLQRSLGRPPWLSENGRLGLCHYIASVAMDRLHAQHGQALWPDKYEYQARGTRKLLREMKRRPSPTVKAAAQWQDMAEAIGAPALGTLLEAWREAIIKKDVVQALVDAAPAQHPAAKSRIHACMKSFSEACLLDDRYSRRREQDLRRDLRRRPITLKNDDGRAEGRERLETDGHVAIFETPDDHWYLTRIEIFGSRIGKKMRKRDFKITLCDEKLQPLASWDHATRKISSRARWHRFSIPPTAVPRVFAVCIETNSTDEKGIWVHRDDSRSGRSAVGLPTKAIRMLRKGNWMVRVRIDTSNTTNPLVWDPYR